MSKKNKEDIKLEYGYENIVKDKLKENYKKYSKVEK